MTNLAHHQEKLLKQEQPEHEELKQKTYQQTGRVGERLCDMNLITEDQLRIALHEQKRKGGLLGETLVRLGFLDEASLTTSLAARAGLPSIDLSKTILDPELLKTIPETTAKRCRALPLNLEDGFLDIAMADPYNIIALDEIRRHIPRDTAIIPHIAKTSDIDTLLENAYTEKNTIEDILEDLDQGTTQETNEAPIIRLVSALLIEAVKRNASDIHIEPETNFIRIRYRIDGHLHQARALHQSHWSALSHRLKIMAGMNIADTRNIQDGRFQIEFGGRPIDCRVAIMPSVQGETIVLRLLDHHKGLLSMEELGFTKEDQINLKEITSRPQGLTLITGPTGSGKTTTLYAILRDLNKIDVNIVSLEEPVEYQINMIRQTAITETQNLNFANGVRGVLRMDPDIIFIGEIRDKETAQMAIRAAMTGHKVFSTLHAPDALGAITRLKDFGISSDLMAENIVGLIAQRLCRTLCPVCKEQRKTTNEEKKLTDLETIFDAKGCRACNNIGRKGRTAIAEILPISCTMETLIASCATRTTLRDEADKEGVQTLQEKGLNLLKEGIIAIDDLRRTIDLTRLKKG